MGKEVAGDGTLHQLVFIVPATLDGKGEVLILVSFLLVERSMSLLRRLEICWSNRLRDNGLR